MNDESKTTSPRYIALTHHDTFQNKVGHSCPDNMARLLLR